MIDFLSPTSDIIFKLLFGDERNTDILTAFLKAVLQIPEDEYDEVTIIDPHLLREFPTDKMGILDVKLKTKSGKIINIEIQLNIGEGFKQRVIYYLSKMVTEQIKANDSHNAIKPVISIIITSKTLIKDSDRYYNRYTFYDRETGSQFSDAVEINTLELSKIPIFEDDGKSELWHWMKFLSAKNEEELNMIAEKNPQVKKAVVRLMELSADERTRLLYESRHKMEWDIQIREQEAIEKGRTEGRAEGRVEGEAAKTISIARNLLGMNLPIENIMKATGLTRAEIESLP